MASMSTQFVLALPVCAVAAMLGASIIGACIENRIRWSGAAAPSPLTPAAGPARPGAAAALVAAPGARELQRRT